MADEIKNSNNLPSDNILQGLIAQLLNGMSVSQKETRDLINQLKNITNNTDKQPDSKSTRDSSRDLQTSLRNIERDIESLNRGISQTAKKERVVQGKPDITQTRAEAELLETRKGIQQDILGLKETLQKEIQAAQQSLNTAKTAEEQKLIMEVIESSQSNLEKQIRTLEYKLSDVDTLLESVEQSSKSIDDWTKATEDSAKTVKSFSGVMDDIGDDEESLFEKQKASIIKTMNADLTSARAKKASVQQEIEILSKSNDVSEHAIKQKQEESAAIDEFIETQEESIESLKNLTFEQQKRIKKEQENAKMWQSTKEGVVKSLKEIPGQIALGIAKWGIFDRIEATLQSGFDKVYQSVETTRNQISARSRLDQGGFTQLQNQIQEEIEQQRLEGVVNQVDINEAIANLSAAGITDPELLKNLAIEQAKATAMGSSLDLTNEGVIQSIIGQLSAGKTWEDIQGVITATRAEELALREQYGQSWALERGGLSRIFEEGLSKATTYGISAEDYITSTAASQQAAGSIGLDPTIFQKTLDAIENSAISDQSTFGQILAQHGLTSDNFENIDPKEQYARMEEVYVNYLKNASREEIKQLQKVIGFDATNRELFTMKQTIDRTGGLGLSGNVDTTQNQQLLDEYEAEAKKGSFISKTEYETNKQLNFIAEQAIPAAEFYKEDQLYHSVTDPILGGLTSAANSIISAIFTNGLGGMFGGKTSGPNTGSGGIFSNMSQGGKDFLTGASGTKAGFAGKALGAAAGVAQLGMTAYKYKDSATAEDFITETLSDPNSIAGIMTTVGSVVAGPIGGIVGQAAAQLGGVISNAIPDSVNDVIGGVAAHLFTPTAFSSIKSDIETANFREFNKMTEQMTKAADTLLESANAQMESVNSQLDTFNSFDTDQQKMYLLQNGLMSAQDLLNKSDKEINEQFKKLIMEQLENERKKAETEARRATFMKESAAGIATFKSNFKNIKKASTDQRESGTSQQEDLITAALGGAESASSIADYILSADSIDKGIEDLFKDANLNEDQTQALSRYVEDIKSRKGQYEEENKKFHSKWNQAKEKAGSDKFTDIFIQYAALFDVEPRLKYDESGQPILVDGLPILYDSQGQYKINQFSEAAGNFKTGLTRVPYDNYPAFLHEGERILTKEEASSYNSLVSYMVKNATSSTSSSNSEVEEIFTNSIITGNTDVKESITTQTETLSAKMDSLISLVSELLKALSITKTTGRDLSAVLKMNSNVMQLNTMV